MSVGQPFLQAAGGDVQDLLAPGLPIPTVSGNKGVGGEGAGQRSLFHGETGLPPANVLRFWEGGHPAALAAQLLHVDLADGQSGGEPALSQQGAVFRDHIVSREHQVGGGLPLAGVGVHIGAHEPGGLAAHQAAAVVGLAHHLVAGGQVQDQGGPPLRQSAGGGVGSPQILADLHADDQPGHIGAADQGAGPEHLDPGAELPLQLGHPDGEAVLLHARPAGKPALFVELPVVGDVGLGHHSHHLAPLDDHGAVIQLVPRTQGHTQGGEHLQLPGGLHDGAQGVHGPVQQGVLQKQIAAGIARDAQLGQDQHLYMLLLRLLHQGDDLPGVIGAVGHPDLRRAGGDFDETVPHKRQLLLLLTDWGILLISLVPAIIPYFPAKSKQRRAISL